MIKRIIIAALLISLISACEHATYEAGDTQDSYLRADFVEVHTNHSKNIYQATNDEGEIITIANPLTTTWAQVADTTYRSLLYYDNTNGMAKVVNAIRIPVITYSDTDSIGNDPLTFQSAWMSKNGRYLNIGFIVKTGKINGEVIPQRIGMVCDSTQISTNGTQTLYLRLTHAQNNAPQYYSTQGYVSIPTHQLPHGTNIQLQVNDYKGKIEKRFIVTF